MIMLSPLFTGCHQKLYSSFIDGASSYCIVHIFTQLQNNLSLRQDTSYCNFISFNQVNKHVTGFNESFILHMVVLLISGFFCNFLVFYFSFTLQDVVLVVSFEIFLIYSWSVYCNQKCFKMSY